MKYLILTDIHANLEALQSVLTGGILEQVDTVLVLGDLVGYGGSPNEVVEAICRLELPCGVVRGNHDKAACRAEEARGLNHVARIAAEWTGRVLTQENRRYLEALSQGPLQVRGELTICHGSIRDEDEYLLSNGAAAASLDRQTTPVAFFGHTHLPTLFVRRSVGAVALNPLESAPAEVELAPEDLYLLNPGSVGQPRDQDPRAAFMTYDSATRVATWHRVEYAVKEAQLRIVEAGLPSILARRLERGA